jgi:acetyl esterase
MTLDPDSAAFVARVRELKLPRYESLSPQDAREAMAAARQAAEVLPPAIGETRDYVMPVAGGESLRGRLYRPIGANGRLPVLVYFHGGGWVIGDLESHDILCRRLSNAAKCAVFAVDYRLAPEYKFPAAVNDAAESAKWVFANAQLLEIVPEKVAAGGDSAGANLAAVLALMSRDGELPKLLYQLLIYPVVDLGFSFPSHQLNEPGLPVLGTTMLWFRDHYLQSVDQAKDWRASPLSATSFSGLAPAYVLTAGYDPLRDEGRAYGERLAQAGVRVRYRHYPGQIHGFLSTGAGFPTTEMAIGEIGEELFAAFNGGHLPNASLKANDINHHESKCEET